MLKKENIKMILESVRIDWDKCDEKDIAFAILCDALEDKTLAYRLAYRKSEKDAAKFYETPRFKKLLDVLEPFGIGKVNNNAITKEENKNELLKMLDKIDQALSDGNLEPKDALKMQTDIRVKLNDKFEMEESQKQKRIIVVPSKHDIVCPTTNRECNYWPSRKACCRHFGLIDPQENNYSQNNNDVEPSLNNNSDE